MNNISSVESGTKPVVSQIPAVFNVGKARAGDDLRNRVSTSWRISHALISQQETGPDCSFFWKTKTEFILILESHPVDRKVNHSCIDYNKFPFVPHLHLTGREMSGEVERWGKEQSSCESRVTLSIAVLALEEFTCAKVI